MSSGDKSRLPVIDISALASGDDFDLSRVADQISQACALSGFFYVRGHGIPDQVISDLRATSRKFFALTGAQKRATAINQHNRGYLARRGADVGGQKNRSQGSFLLGT